MSSPSQVPITNNNSVDIRSDIYQKRVKLGSALVELEPSAIIELYELYFDINMEPFRFHAGTNNLQKDILWNGNSYYATAIEVEGFEANIVGRLPRPKVTVSNQDFIISNILRDYSDFRNGKFVRIKVFLKHLDNENFDENINPFGQVDPMCYISREIYLISQKIIENRQIVQFELITPFDLESLETATRAIYGRYCYWQYRGAGCNYQGDLICKEDEKDFSVNPKKNIKTSIGSFVNGSLSETANFYKWKENFYYVAGDIVNVTNIDFNGLKDPPLTWFVCIKDHNSSKLLTPNKSADLWEKDSCSKSLNACKKRFFFKNYTSLNGYVAFNDFDTVNGIMPYGGFPGTDRFSYE
jgi:lambda family phage minor tail protein L